MKSTNAYINSLEEKIVYSIERLTHIYRILLWNIGKEKKLSPIQIQFLIYLRNHPQNMRKVSYLAREFGLSQATVSDAVKTLISKGYLIKRPQKRDGRVSLLDLTPTGRHLVIHISGWSNVLKEHVSEFQPETLENVLLFMMELIENLKDAGVIQVARMCFDCENFQKDADPESATPHYCHFRSMPISNFDLNVDCLEHHPKSASTKQ